MKGTISHGRGDVFPVVVVITTITSIIVVVVVVVVLICGCRSRPVTCGRVNWIKLCTFGIAIQVHVVNTQA